MTRIRRVFQHILNPLHVYCRLKDVGVSAPMAQRVCRVYERFLFRFLP